MGKNIKVTISFPVYNVEKTIKASLMSALDQTYDNFEIVAVDDCSKDKSMDILRDVISSHPQGEKIRIIHHPQNLGLGYVRNTSIEEAYGDYIYFMDSDDLLERDTIEKLVSYMEKFKVDFVASSYVEIRNGAKYNHVYKKVGLISGNDIMIKHYKEEEIYVHMWNKLIALDFLRQYRIRCIYTYVEDDTFTFDMLRYAKSCYKTDEITYHYLVRDDSITSSLMSNNLNARTAEIYEGIIKYKIEKIKELRDLRIRSLASIYVINSAFLRLYETIKSSIKKEQKKEISRNIANHVMIKNITFSISIMNANRLIKYFTILFASLLPIRLKIKYMLMIQELKK